MTTAPGPLFVLPRPRVLIVTRTLDSGGTERHIAAIATRLAAHGFDMTIVCIGKRGVLADDVEQTGVRVIGPGLPDRLIAGSTIIQALALGQGSMRLLFEMVRRPPVIAHFFLPHAYIAGAIAAILARVPIPIMSRRSQNDYQRKHPLMARLEHRLHRHMTVILGNSRRVVRELAQQEGVPKAKLGLLHNGIDLGRYQGAFDRTAVRERLDLPADALIIASVANLIAYKGHADLIAALGRLAGRLARPWQLLIIGRDDGLGAAITEQAKVLGIATNVRFLGERHDVPDLLRASDVAVLASHEEGFSNAVLEGMAAGLAMVVTDVGGNAEAVLDGHCGLVVPPRDADALDEALLKLASDAELRWRMGQTARERAFAMFGIEVCVERYVRLYGALLNGKLAEEALAAMNAGDWLRHQE